MRGNVSIEGFQKEWIINSIKFNGIYHLIILKEQVKRKDITAVKQVISICEEIGRNAKEKIAITFHGYDSDPREIYEIDEIREYVKEVFQLCPHILYFLTNFNYLRNAFILCLLDINHKIKIHQNFIRVYPKMKDSYVEAVIKGLMNYGIKIGEDPEIITDLIYDCLGISYYNTQLKH